MLNKNLCARLRKQQSQKLSPIALIQCSKNTGKTSSPLSPYLTSFKNQLKLNRKMSKHRHLFLTKSRSFKSCNVNQEERKTKMPIKKNTTRSFNISKAANWRRIDAALDHPRKEKQGHTHVEDTAKLKFIKIQVHLTWTRSLLEIEKLSQQPDTQNMDGSSNSHQVFSRDTHRTLSFQHEAVKLVDTWLPSPKPTSLLKGWKTKIRLSFFKKWDLKQSAAHRVVCLHLLSGWSHKCQKKLK